ncbi:MAG: hypothetical protein QS748_06840 [Candidatus Endonucleobacter bathymodioli]|uniref:Uncharacterized protein n=1 Tax=Candidatus Endonucleibacter bathymodioli TaxID=539814 RepID=A0AA90NTF2_9GAMM|nr:hypothetical protein [Candidatus Endonucleobacter bathymodioli]
MEETNISGKDFSDNRLWVTYLAQGGTLRERRGLSQNQMDTIYRVGFGYYSTKNYKESLVIFKYLSLLDHRNHSYLLGLGVTLKEIQQYDEAMAVLDCAIHIDETDPRSYICMALCMIELNNLTDADIFLLKAEAMAKKSTKWIREFHQIKKLKTFTKND